MVTIKDLEFAYQRGKPILSGLQLSLFPGHIYGLLGRNGVGKSTLLKTIAGLVYPTAGTCTVFGRQPSKRQVSLLENLFMVPEEIYLPPVTAGQFVANNAIFYPRFNKEAFFNYLRKLDADPNVPMQEMSHGQQKKVLISFGLASNTDLLIMDEPTNGLDIPSKVQFRKLMASILTDERCIIISTHQVRDLDSLIDTVVILENRQVMTNHSIDQLSELLAFGNTSENSGLSVLYEEESIRGNTGIMENTAGRYSKLDLELLFNGVVAHAPGLLGLLTKTLPHE